MTNLETLMEQHLDEYRSLEVVDNRHAPLLIANTRARLSDVSTGGKRKFQTGLDTILAYYMRGRNQVILATLEQQPKGQPAIFTPFHDELVKFQHRLTG